MIHYLSRGNGRADVCTQIHPYAQIALGKLTSAAQVCFWSPTARVSHHCRQLIIIQTNLDQSISSLLERVQYVYEFLLEEDTLSNLDTMKDTLARIAQVISNCAQFVKDYSETKRFCTPNPFLPRQRSNQAPPQGNDSERTSCPKRRSLSSITTRLLMR